MNRAKLSRRELYNLVWSTPMVNLVDDVGVSAVAIARICRELEIPYPPKGYWRKSIENRRAIKRPKLPCDTYSANRKITAPVKLKGGGGQKRLSPEERKSELLDLAAHIVEQEGVTECTVSRIAQKAEISHSLVSRYLGSRESILIELARREWVAQVGYSQSMASEAAGKEQQARVFLASYLKVNQERGPVLNLLIAVPEVAESLSELISTTIHDQTPATAAYFGELFGWRGGESVAKTEVLSAINMRVARLLNAKIGSFSECFSVALSFVGMAEGAPPNV